MPRVPLVSRDDMPPEAQGIWDEIDGARGGVPRNYLALLNNPEAAQKLAVLGGYTRFGTRLDQRTQALTMLAAARAANGHYVWTANQQGARDAGLTDDVISAIRERRAPDGLDDSDAIVVRFVQELLSEQTFSDDAFEALRGEIGDAAIIDLLIVATFYDGMARMVEALEVDPPGGMVSDLRP